MKTLEKKKKKPKLKKITGAVKELEKEQTEKEEKTESLEEFLEAPISTNLKAQDIILSANNPLQLETALESVPVKKEEEVQKPAYVRENLYEKKEDFYEQRERQPHQQINVRLENPQSILRPQAARETRQAIGMNRTEEFRTHHLESENTLKYEVQRRKEASEGNPLDIINQEDKIKKYKR